MSNLTAIDADGDVIEKESEIRKYLKEPGISVRQRFGRATNRGTTTCLTTL
jgi:hypothetical protein